MTIVTEAVRLSLARKSGPAEDHRADPLIASTEPTNRHDGRDCADSRDSDDRSANHRVAAASTDVSRFACGEIWARGDGTLTRSTPNPAGGIVRPLGTSDRSFATVDESTWPRDRHPVAATSRAIATIARFNQRRAFIACLPTSISSDSTRDGDNIGRWIVAMLEFLPICRTLVRHPEKIS